MTIERALKRVVTAAFQKHALEIAFHIPETVELLTFGIPGRWGTAPNHSIVLASRLVSGHTQKPRE